MKKIALFVFMMTVLSLSCSSDDASIFGTWTLNKDNSTDLVTWRYRQPELTIMAHGDTLCMKTVWKSRRAGDFMEKFMFVPDGDTSHSTVASQHWVENWYMGVLSKEGSQRSVWGTWNEKGKKLQVETWNMVRVSQGETSIHTVRDLAVNRKGDRLVVTEKRSSRPADIKLVFDRKEKE